MKCPLSKTCGHGRKAGPYRTWPPTFHLLPRFLSCFCHCLSIISLLRSIIVGGWVMTPPHWVFSPLRSPSSATKSRTARTLLGGPPSRAEAGRCTSGRPRAAHRMDVGAPGGRSHGGGGVTWGQGAVRRVCLELLMEWATEHLWAVTWGRIGSAETHTHTHNP